MWSTTLPASLVDEVTEYATRGGTTPYAVLLAAFSWLLSDLTGAPAAVVSCPVANRGDARFADVVGVFTHTSLLIVPTRGARTFTDLVSRATRSVWQRLALQAVPVDVINAALGAPFAGNPPRVLFSLFNTEMPALDLPGIAPATPRDVPLAGARADQSWLFGATDGGAMELDIEYSLDLFDQATVSGWGEEFLSLLRRAMADPDMPLHRTQEAA